MTGWKNKEFLLPNLTEDSRPRICNKNPLRTLVPVCLAYLLSCSHNDHTYTKRESLIHGCKTYIPDIILVFPGKLLFCIWSSENGVYPYELRPDHFHLYFLC